MILEMLRRLVFDNAPGMSRLERMKLLNEHNKLRAGVESLVRLPRMKAMTQINAIRAMLGAGGVKPAVAEPDSGDTAFLQSLIDRREDLLADGVIERFRDLAGRGEGALADLIARAKTAAREWMVAEQARRSA